MKLFIILITSLIVLLLLFLVILPLTVQWPFKISGKEKFENNKYYGKNIPPLKNKEIYKKLLQTWHSFAKHHDINYVIWYGRFWEGSNCKINNISTYFRQPGNMPKGNIFIFFM